MAGARADTNLTDLFLLLTSSSADESSLPLSASTNTNGLSARRVSFRFPRDLHRLDGPLLLPSSDNLLIILNSEIDDMIVLGFLGLFTLVALIFAYVWYNVVVLVVIGILIVTRR